MMIRFAIIFYMLLNTNLVLAQNYKVDEDLSSMEFQVRHMLISTTKGTFDRFNGYYEYNTEAKKITSLEGEAWVDSINTKDIKRDDYLKSEEFFDSKRYPKISLKLLKNGMVKITIKGISKEVSFDIEFVNGILTLNGQISREEFGLFFSKLAEAGGIAVGDKVKISIEIRGTKI